MYIESMGLNGRDGGVGIMFQFFVSEPLLGIGVDIEACILQKVIVECGDVYLPMYALGNTGHLRMAVPVEFESIGDQNKEKREFGLNFDRKGNNGLGLPQLIHDMIEFRQFDLTHLLDQKLVVLRVTKVLSIKIIVFAGNAANQTEQVFQVLTFMQQRLQLMDLL